MRPHDHPDWVSFRTWQLCRLPEPHRSIAQLHWYMRDHAAAAKALNRFVHELMAVGTAAARAGAQLNRALHGCDR